jgi:hypothetical protein
MTSIIALAGAKQDDRVAFLQSSDETRNACLWICNLDRSSMLKVVDVAQTLDP